MARSANATSSSTTSRRAAAVVAGIVAGALVHLIATGPLGVEVVVPMGPDAEGNLTLVMVVLVSAVSGLAGWGIAALLERGTAAPARAWTSIAVAVYLLSLVPVFATGVDAAAAVTLLLEHTAVAAAVVLLMRQTLAPAG